MIIQLLIQLIYSGANVWKSKVSSVDLNLPPKVLYFCWLAQQRRLIQSRQNQNLSWKLWYRRFADSPREVEQTEGRKMTPNLSECFNFCNFSSHRGSYAFPLPFNYFNRTQFTLLPQTFVKENIVVQKFNFFRLCPWCADSSAESFVTCILQISCGSADT